ncbi:MAG: chalcone isomerase family protein [Cytophagaceae bacterium]
MVLNKYILLSLAVLVQITAFAGSPMPPVLEIQNQKLTLNGSGIRNKYMIDLFEGGLYLKEKCQNAEKIIRADELMSIRIVVTSKVITAKRLEENIRSEFLRLTNGLMDGYKDRLESLVKAMARDVYKGDVFDLTYKPDEGLKIYKNNVFQVTIPGLDFKKILFSIYLGNDPCDARLKNNMLGNS